MGLADRFKQNLEKRDIFSKVVEQTDDAEIQKFSSNPITQEISIKTQKLHSDISCNPFGSIIEAQKQLMSSELPYNKFEDLEFEIISKIRKTPYWSEYDMKNQSNMIKAYFDKKVQSSKYCNIKYSQDDRLEFVRNIIALSNSK